MADDRSRLEKLVGMLASDFEGEQLNALRMIKALAAKENKTLAEVLLSGRERVVDRVVYKDRPESPRYQPARRWGRYENDERFSEDPGYGFREERERPRRRQDQRKLLDGLKAALENGDGFLDFEEIEFCQTVPYRYSFDWELSLPQKRMAKQIIRKVRYGNAEPLI